MSEFWAMTPRELFLAMDAAIWRMEQEQRGRGWLAWHVGALMRVKRLPSLMQLLGQAPKPVSKEDMEQRRREFEEMKQAWLKRR